MRWRSWRRDVADPYSSTLSGLGLSNRFRAPQPRPQVAEYARPVEPWINDWRYYAGPHLSSAAEGAGTLASLGLSMLGPGADIRDAVDESRAAGDALMAGDPVGYAAGQLGALGGLLGVVVPGSARGYGEAADSLADAARRDIEGWRAPQDYYLHGRAGADNLDTGYVTQATRSPEVATQYAGQSGSIWALQPTASSNLIDATDEKTRRDIVAALLRDYRAGLLSYGLEDSIKGAIADRGLRGGLRNMADQVNPEDIVSHAGWHDSPDFTSWLWERFAPDVVETNDGAVFYNPSGVNRARVR